MNPQMSRLVVGVSVLLGGLATAFAQSSSGLDPASPWPKVGQNIRSTGVGLGLGPQTNALAWAAGVGWSGAAVDSRGVIYCGGTAVNSDGTLRWIGPGGNANSVPAVAADGTVYFCAYYEVIAVNESQLGAHVDNGMNLVGGIKWRYSGTIGDTQNSPTIRSDGVVLIGTQSAAENGRVYAINPNGSQAWVFTPPTTSNVETTVAIDEASRTLYCGTSAKQLLAINYNGTLKWKLALSDHVHGDPAIGADGTIYTSSRDGVLYAVSPLGKSKWTAKVYQSKSKPGGFGTPTYIGPAQPAIDSYVDSSGKLVELIYVGGADGLYSFTTAGALRWRYALPSAAAVNTHLAIDGAGVVYASAADGTFMAVRRSGTLAWSRATGVAANLALAGGRLIAGGGELMVLEDGGVCPPRIRRLVTAIMGVGYSDLFVSGDLLALEAEGVVDGDGSVADVRYYLDDGDGLLNVSLDELLGHGDPGLSWDLVNVDTTLWAPGSYRVFAVATDNSGQISNIAAHDIVVVSP